MIDAATLVAALVARRVAQERLLPAPLSANPLNHLEAIHTYFRHIAALGKGGSRLLPPAPGYGARRLNPKG